MRFCAICTADKGPFSLQPLGKDDAMVSVCATCSEPAFERRGPEVAYEPSGLVSHAAMKRAIQNVPQAKHPTPQEYGRQGNAGEYASKRPAGWRVFRGPMFYEGKRITRDTAWAEVQKKPWFAPGRVMAGGHDKRFYIWFYAPDVKLSPTNADPLEAIEQFRKEP